MHFNFFFLLCASTLTATVVVIPRVTARGSAYILIIDFSDTRYNITSFLLEVILTTLSVSFRSSGGGGMVSPASLVDMSDANSHVTVGICTWGVSIVDIWLSLERDIVCIIMIFIALIRAGTFTLINLSTAEMII